MVQIIVQKLLVNKIVVSLIMDIIVRITSIFQAVVAVFKIHLYI